MAEWIDSFTQDEMGSTFGLNTYHGHVNDAVHTNYLNSKETNVPMPYMIVAAWNAHNQAGRSK